MRAILLVRSFPQVSSELLGMSWRRWEWTVEREDGEGGSGLLFLDWAFPRVGSMWTFCVLTSYEVGTTSESESSSGPLPGSDGLGCNLRTDTWPGLWQGG